MKKPWLCTVSRADRWHHSVGTMLVRVWFYAPSKALHDVGDTVLALLTSLLILPLLVVNLFLYLLVMTGAGFAGYLKRC